VNTLSRKLLCRAILLSALFLRFISAAASPGIQSISPAPGSTVSGLSQITVTFSVPVVGVQASDLQINGLPAVLRSGSNAVATFHFSQPAPGPVTVNFDSDATITDQAGNAFDPLAPDAAWTYTLADLVSPVVAVSEPAAGAVVGSLTQVEVFFTEPVAGVEASDFRVNGVPASSMSTVAPDRYRFAFAEPALGTVTISWNAGHGIQDLSPAGNTFSGAGWSYTLNSVAADGDVVINEFLAENQNSIEDADGQKEDWIELRNRGANAVTLAGWSLTDDPALPGKWVFPNVTLGAGQYLLVFASGKDRTTAAANATNHTNFRLNVAGGYLGLFNANFPRVAVSHFIAYPEQRADISYGLAASGAATYFETLTPRAANNDASAADGFVQAPHASVKSGFFNQPFNLVLSTETPGAEVRYTLDGSEPTTSSEPYTGPIFIGGLPTKAVVTVRAVGFKAGQVKSPATTRTYIFPDHVLTQPANPAGFPSVWDSPCTGFNNCNDINPADYEMDPQVITNTAANYRALAREGLVSIPTVSIVTDVNLLFSAAQGVYVRREPFLRKKVNAEFITVDGSDGFQIDCGLEMQGQTSPDDSSTGGSKWKSLKLGLRLFFQGEFGPTKLRYKVFEDSPVDSFDTLLLAGGHNNYWNYNNNDTQRTRSLYVRDQFVANLQNAVGGLSHHGRFVHLYLNGLYWGLYQMHERPDDSFQASYQGGEKNEYDVFKHDSGAIVAGNNASYTAMWAVINAGLASNTNYELLQQRLDVPGLIDYLLINFWANNTDWDHKNLYASSRRQGGKWRFHAWDSEHVIADSDFTVLGDNNGSNPTAILTRLLANGEFRILLADQIHKHFFNGGIFYTDPANPIYNPSLPERNRPAHLFMRMLQEIDTAIVCESARWGDVGPGRENNPHTRNISFYDERDMVMGYRATSGSHSSFNFSTRSSGLLAQFRTRGWYPTVVAPSFNQHGGRVAPGFNLTISAPAGTIHYTTNGADPRVYGSSAISPGALIYSGTPVTLPVTTVVKARVLSGTNWSALNEATFVIAEPVSPLRITEIMYNPPGGDAFEFLEMKNTGSLSVDLGGHSFDGINFLFPPNTSIAPGAILVLANNASPAAFAARYPGVVVAGYFGGALANGGERIALKNPAGMTIVSVTYGDSGGWPASADGGGASLELIDLAGATSEPANWQASAAANGSPGQPNSTLTAPAVILNEVGAENLSAVNNAGSFPDWVELRNTTALPVSLATWSLSDDGNPRKFIFPGGTMIPANGYLVVWCDAATNTTPGLHAGFGLDREGDSLFLYNAQTQRVDAVTFGMQVANLTIGRVNGGWTLTIPTPDAANAAASVAAQSELSINEWMANAAPGADDWLELYNRSASVPVSLRGIYLGTSNALFQVRSLSYLAPNGFVQLLADEGGGPNHLDFKLPAGGGEIALFDAAATLIERVTYTQQTEAISQGRLPNGSATITGFAGSASPGASNYVVTYTGPVLNEILARNDFALSPWAEYADWIELANTTASPVSLAGLSVSDSPGGAGQWVFPAGATLPGNGHLRVWCDGGRAGSLSAGADMNTGFSLSGESGGVYLFNAAGQMVDAVEYGFQVSDLSIGRDGGVWRLLATPSPNAANSAAASLGAQSALKLNEWMPEPFSGNDWFELYNPGALPVDLAGLYLTDDPSIIGLTQHQVASLSFIDAGGLVKFEADGDPSQGRHHVSFNLNRFGDALRLYAPNLAMIDSADLVALPAGVSAGRLPDGSGNTMIFYTTPTPAENNYLPLQSVAINEVLTHTDPPLEDSIELFNSSAQTTSLGGYYLSDNPRDLKKYRIANGTSLAAGGFLVFGESQFNSGAPGSFALNSSRGGSVYLSAADAGGNLTGYRSLLHFGPQANGVSFGRFQTSVGEDFPALTSRTLGSANSAPRIGPVVINEVMYHPVDEAGNVEVADYEFVELHNLSGNSVPLFDPANPANTWRVTGAVTFRFPSGVSLPARGYVLLVHFDPVADGAAASAFRAGHGLPPGVALYGPFSGRLGNDGEDLALEMPDRPQGPGPEQGYVPYVLVDRVAYGDSYPWPPEANGGGASLQRRRPYAYGNDPLNWKGTAPTAGRANVAGSTFLDTDQDGLPDEWENTHGLSRTDASDATQDRDGDGHSNYEEYLDGTDLASAASALTAPMIVSHPSDQNVIPGQNAVLSITPNGTAPLQYQWLKNGFPLDGATNNPLILPIAGPFDTADYSVVVWNGAGFAISRSARLTVVVPPRITLQPVGLSVNPGSNVTFTVAATGTGLVRYQWRFNGQDVPGATSPTLILSNVQLGNDGSYVAMITDDFATIASTVARLIVRVTPRILVPPVPPTNSLPGGYHSLVVPVGSAVTLATTIEGNPPPFGYFWSVGAFRLPATISNSRTNITTLIATNIPALNIYRLVVTNVVQTNYGLGPWSATFVITTVADNDRDGLPDNYEVNYGLSTNDMLDAVGDLDGDGMRNLDEYRAGTDPANSASYLRVATGTVPGQATVLVSAVSNRTYTVQYAEDLNAGQWRKLGDIFARATNRVETFVDPESTTNRFYRVMLPLQP
jgi:hypothetical protein